MTLTSGDVNVVRNLREEYGDDLLIYSDETIAETWREFSQSDEYPAKDNPSIFLEWIKMAHERK